MRDSKRLQRRFIALIGFTTMAVVSLWIQIVGSSAIAQSAFPDYSAQRAYEHVTVLAGEVGERAAGTDAEKRAVDYIAGRFREWGLKTTIEPVRVPVWTERRSRLWAKGQETYVFNAKAAVFSGLTPAEGITGELVDIGSASAREIEGKDLDGKIALVKRDVYIDYPDIWLTDRLAPMGIAGMIFYSSPRRSGIPTVYFNFKRALNEPTPPSVVISYEDALRLVQMPSAEVTIVVEADIEWSESYNVIGELAGSTQPDEIVVLGAHNDTSYDSPGASDDGGGVAAVMELASAFSERERPARTIRFIAWGGHELGLMGSETYLRARRDEVEKTAAYINYDGLGSTLGTIRWSAAGGPKWIEFLGSTADAIGMSGPIISPSGTDAMNFSALEIPSIQIGQSGSVGQNHTPFDDLSAISPVGFEDGLLLGAAVVDRLANDTRLSFSADFSPDLLQMIRDYAAQWGWGVRPEANRPPRTR
jgi:carboxypeptidase Q